MRVAGSTRIMRVATIRALRAPQLPRAEEQAVRRAAATLAVVDHVRRADAGEPAQLAQRLHRQASVREAVVHDQVSDPEQAHPEAGAKDQIGREPRLGAAAVEDGGDRDRRVQRAERIVVLEHAAALVVVRAVDAPEDRVPHAPVQQHRPQIHEHRDGEPHRDANDPRIHRYSPCFPGTFPGAHDARGGAA